VQQVLSTYLTGFGCTGEHEVVVLAHNNLKAFTVPYGASGAGSAAASVHAQVGSKAPAPAKKTYEELVAAAHAALKPAKAPASAPAAHAHGDTAAKLAALKKAVINAKSKAYKAGKVAFATKHPSKVAHAQQAAKEAEAAVQALNEFKKGGMK
jgi:hypothetical protein